MIQFQEKRILAEASKKLAFDLSTSTADKTAACKEFLKEQTAIIKQRHRDGSSGMVVVKELTCVVDCLVKSLAAPALQALKEKDFGKDLSTAIVAIGGYGRAELSPLSDVDIMFLYPSKSNSSLLEKGQEHMVHSMLYPLWDCGLKVGHSSRTVDDVFDEARSDIQTKTSLLESRILYGSDQLYKGFRKSYYLFYRKENPKEYIDERLKDQKDRRAKFGSSVFLQEPDIKNGVGGLRDYHNTLWMAQVRLDIQQVEGLEQLHYLKTQELKEFNEAYNFLIRTRNELHFRSKRPTDLLSLEVQPKVAKSLGYTEADMFARVETFMKDYYKHANTIFEISTVIENRLSLKAVKEESSGAHGTLNSIKEFLKVRRKDKLTKLDGFIIRASEISTDNPDVFKDDPLRLIRIFRHKQLHDVKLDFELRALIRASLPMIDENIINSEAANSTFRTILQETGNVYPTLNSMHEHGVLGHFVPEWGKLTCLVQHEYFHRYTADIHILHTVRELDNIFTDPDPIYRPYREVLHSLDQPKLLYLILFLHDIGKAKGIKNHAENGIPIAEKILERMRLDEGKRKLVRFIIRNHLEMARFWQRYDLDDPETAKVFADKVETTEQLRLLYTHTFCDARGTAQRLWNSYKDTLHRTLYTRTLEVLKTNGKIDELYKKQKEMTRQELLELNIEGVSNEEINAHFKLLPDRYFINTMQDEIILHIKMINQLLRDISNAESIGALQPVIDWNQDVNRSYTVINVVTWDRAGLFHKLAGSLNIAGYSILSAKATSRDDHIAIDTFYVTESERGYSNAKKARQDFEASLNDSLINNADLYPRIREINKQLASNIFTAKDNPLADTFKPQVEVYQELSLKRTILEVQAKDHVGLLYQISNCVSAHEFDIAFARINTERGIAIDTLHLAPGNNKKAIKTEKLEELKKDLLQALQKES
ncbi:[protein-PII] uridylyltransferase [Puniceicoccaceae bacterium K14]|nr:[protein-PII] uridylyltransferase [Puniceicoccaceae bacterium K14]